MSNHQNPPHEFPFITTRGGDEGKTSLIDGERRFKNETIFTALGDLDEFSSVLGLARSEIGRLPEFRELTSELLAIQKKLIIVGGIVATPSPLTPARNVSSDDVLELENSMKKYFEGLRLDGFILPGASKESALLDHARAVGRRLERSIVALIVEAQAFTLKSAQAYINRTADYLFVAARWVNRTRGIVES